jgi:aspartyl-tRNA synthetase
MEQQMNSLSVADEDPSKNYYGDVPFGASTPVTGPWTEIKDINPTMVGQTVTIRARVHNTRATAKNCFLVIRQRYDCMQAVLFAQSKKADGSGVDISKEMVKWCGQVPRESIVDLVGVLAGADVKSELITQNKVELAIQQVHVVSRAQTIPPFSLDDAARPEEGVDASLPRVNLDTRLNHRHIDLRTPCSQAIFKVQAGVCSLFREYLDARGFTEIHSPKIISAASEGGANVFKINYFKGEAFLAQSPQFYKQMAMCADFGRVYEIAPVFRAENSFTHRHMTEFVGLDLEMAIQRDYHEVVKLMGNMFLFMFRELPKRFPAEHKAIHAQYPAVQFEFSEEPLILPFWEGIKMLKEDGVPIGDHDDLSTEQERRLGRLVKDKFKTDFYILDKYPLAVRPFYTMPEPAHPGYSRSYDFFIRGEEIMSGAQRVDSPVVLEERARACGVDPATVSSYIDAFRVGVPPHAGGGVGLERVVMLYFDLKNIRKTSLFPRDPSRLTP